METRIFKKKHFFTKYLVKWKGYFLENTTSERKKNPFKKIPKFKGIEDNTWFLKGGQCNNPLENDMEKVEECDGVIYDI